MSDGMGIFPRVIPFILCLVFAVLIGSPSGAMAGETNTGESKVVPDGPTFVEMAPEGMPTGMRVLYAPSDPDAPGLRKPWRGCWEGPSTTSTPASRPRPPRALEL